jgi:hypothetical protein
MGNIGGYRSGHYKYVTQYSQTEIYTDVWERPTAAILRYKAVLFVITAGSISLCNAMYCI